MVTHAWCACLVVALGLGSAGQPGNAPLTVGVAPFDVAAVEGATMAASDALARLVRVEMLKSKGLQPELLELPPGTRPPLASKTAAALGRKASVDLVLVGTILEAKSSHSSHGASTGRFGISLGGRVNRSSANVTVHIELVNPATPGVPETFEVKGKASGTGIGADMWTALGSFTVGDAGWETTPMGKALREVAQKIVKETTVRASKVARRGGTE